MDRRYLLGTSAAAVIMLMTGAAFADPMSDAQAIVDKYASKVETWDGPTTGPKAADGKTIVVLAGDLKNGGILGVTSGIQEAATAMGWEVKVLDGAGSINAVSYTHLTLPTKRIV